MSKTPTPGPSLKNKKQLNGEHREPSSQVQLNLMDQEYFKNLHDPRFQSAKKSEKTSRSYFYGLKGRNSILHERALLCEEGKEEERDDNSRVSSNLKIRPGPSADVNALMPDFSELVKILKFDLKNAS